MAFDGVPDVRCLVFPDLLYSLPDSAAQFFNIERLQQIGIIQPFDTQPVLDTEDDWVLVWGILDYTRYPKEAVQILNLLYEDKDILNLILYGIEGQHYEVLEDGSFTWPAGVTRENVSYVCWNKWKYNTLKAGIWHGMSDDLEGEMQDLRSRAKVSSYHI